MVLFKIYSYFLNVAQAIMDFMPYFIRDLWYRAVLKKLGKNGFIDYGVYIRYPFKVSIGDNVWINRNCSLYPSAQIKEAEIVIGNNVAIGPETSLFSAGHDHRQINLPDIARTIRIGDHVWIGGKSIILPGVEIGEGAVVGAGSVVTKNVAPYTIVAGNPARMIKNRDIQTGNGC